MLFGFEEYNTEKFSNKSCLLVIVANKNCIFDIFKSKKDKVMSIIKKDILWIGYSNNSDYRLRDFLSDSYRKTSLLRSFAKLLNIDSSNKEEYSNFRKEISVWLKENTKCYARNFDKEILESIKKYYIKKYTPPLNIKYNKQIYNSL